MRRIDTIIANALKRGETNVEIESEAQPPASKMKENLSPNIYSHDQIEKKAPQTSTTVPEFVQNASEIVDKLPNEESTTSSLHEIESHISADIQMESPLGDENSMLKLAEHISRRPSREKTVSTSSRSSSTSSSSSSNSSSSDSSGVSSKVVSTVAEINAGASTSRQIKSIKRGSNNTQTYRISPLNSGESDPDFSDYDPTFQDDNEVSICPESSSSSYEDHETSANIIANTAQKKSRKRQRQPSEWNQNKIKQLRNSGKAYTSSSKKEIPPRSMKSPYCNCRLNCSSRVEDIDRAGIFQSYWNLGSLTLQRAFIASCLTEVKPKYKYTNAQKPRLPNTAFYFAVNGVKVRVCKTHFTNTLDITERQIRTVKKKITENGFMTEDQRGKHESRKKIDINIIKEIEDHINSIPRIESHYLRASTSREYIDGGMTVKELCRDFAVQREKQNKPKVEYWLYLNIFNTKFNIGFFQPKKDRCDLCSEYEIASSDQKIQLEQKYDTHLKEKKLCRIEKKNDRNNIGNGNICTIYDLQAVMQCPRATSSSFFYVSKLNCFNFTMAELEKNKGKTKKTKNKSSTQKHSDKDKEGTGDEDNNMGAYGNVFNYFWDETQGNRGANEIGSCVFDYLRKVSETYPDKELNIVFYSDNCCGQNKNKFITCLYSYAVSKFSNIESITHKFLIKGHTQNEGDNVHSLIEKEVNRNLRSGPIWTSHQYVTLIKNARKSGKSFQVMELTFDFFMDLKAFHGTWGYNFTEDDDHNTVSWNDIKVLRFLKEDPFAFFLKVSYAQENFVRVNMRNKRRRMPNLDEVIMTKAFTQKLKLSENKIKGLNDLLRKNLIPGFYMDFYRCILDAE